MVGLVHSNHRGLRDWIVQRITAVLLGVYTIFILSYLLCNKPVNYVQWYTLFHHPVMKVVTFIVLLSVMWHAWIGLWTVFTDYVKNAAVRLSLEALLIVLLLAYLAWGFEILWY